MMFTSAASGYAACVAFVRGLSGRGKDMGNFYADLIRITTRVLIPLSIIVVFIVSMARMSTKLISKCYFPDY